MKEPAYIVQANIENYVKLLASPFTSDIARKTIETLFAEARASLRASQESPSDYGRPFSVASRHSIMELDDVDSQGMARSIVLLSTSIKERG